MKKCANCGKDIPEIKLAYTKIIPGVDSPVILCKECAKLFTYKEKSSFSTKNILYGLGLGIMAGFVSSLIWYGFVVLTELMLGWIAIGVGWLVTKAMIYGSGGKRGIPIQISSAIIVILSLSFSEYLIVRHFVVIALKEQGISGIPLIMPISEIVYSVFEGIKLNPITLIFWFIAVIEAVTLSRKQSLISNNEDDKYKKENALEY